VSTRLLIICLTGTVTLSFVVGTSTLEATDIPTLATWLDISTFELLFLCTCVCVAAYMQWLTHPLSATADLVATAIITVVLNFNLGILCAAAYTEQWWWFCLLYCLAAILNAVSLPALVTAHEKPQYRL